MRAMGCCKIQSMGKIVSIDFSALPENQNAMHERLLNWARAQRSTSHCVVAPMFRQYRSSDQWSGSTAHMPVDQQDAARINSAWQLLPAKPRAALAWHYITPGSPSKACRAIACTMSDLAQYVIDARQMLINRLGCANHKPVHNQPNV